MIRQLETIIPNNLTSETEYSASRATKKFKTEPTNPLLLEIKEVNHKFFNVVVDIIDKDDVSMTGFNKGTLLRCSYIPMGLRNTEVPNASKQMFPTLVLELIVDVDYPSSSPTILDPKPPSFSEPEEKDLWEKARSKLGYLLRKLHEPISLKQMVEAWNVSTHEVFLEFAEQMGGGSFSTNYGKWEEYVLAI
ncbi:mediator of RNA polymerase II transcription subunit 15a-like [Andrographis paniculata]|uniref:mediator of RNA polymerase II transcription subunit 15a-like n=1 Tax=Andrographis paniculata TaxID=175694 RepID=UPI0021E906E4|nr:mediator of RNA polymerase II transcription subunit 15a-like [Andrographis paniculata]